MGNILGWHLFNRWTQTDNPITTNLPNNTVKVQEQVKKQLMNIYKCNNPRCITTVEQGINHVFELTDEENNEYRCKYCEQLKEE